MAKKNALSFLPKTKIVTYPGLPCSLESLKGFIYSVADLQEQEVGIGSYLLSKVPSRAPFESAVFDISNGVPSTGTVTFATATNGQTVTVNGLVYTGVASKTDNTEFSTGGTDAQDAASLAESINGDTRTGTLSDVGATSSGAVVTIYSKAGGTAGNAITLSSSSGITLAVSGATLAGGADTEQFNGFFVSEVMAKSPGVYGRPGLSSRRSVDVEIEANANTFTARSAAAVIEFIQGLEDKVAETGLGASGDGTYTNAVLNGFTPFETFTWTIVKLGDVYTVTPTANS